MNGYGYNIYCSIDYIHVMYSTVMDMMYNTVIHLLTGLINYFYTCKMCQVTPIYEIRDVYLW